MLKKTGILLCLLTVVFFSAGCQLTSVKENETMIEAQIIEIDFTQQQLLITGKDKSSLSLIGDRCIVPLKGTKIFDATQKRIQPKELKEDQIIEILYEGAIQESYPTVISQPKQIRLKE